MREQSEWFSLVVQVSFGRPIELQVVHLPTFLWIFPVFSLAQRVEFCKLPPLVHYFEDNVAWSTNSWSLAPNRRFWRQCCQIAARYQLQLLMGFQTGRRYFSRQTWKRPYSWCWHELLPLPIYWSNPWLQTETFSVRLLWVGSQLCPSPIVRMAKGL